MRNVSLEKGTIQETMLLPLWGRSQYSRLYPEFINDREAEKIIAYLDFDFTDISKTMGEYGGIAYLVRAKRFDASIRDYLARHPQATVVNLGAGLDTTFSRVDNGQIRWFNLDMPDAIAFRRELIPDTPRSTCIERSALDLKWINEVEFEPDKGIFLVLGGLLMYFKTHQVRDLFCEIAAKFPGGEIHFDSLSRLGRGFINTKLKRINAPTMHFFVNHSQRLFPRWSPKLQVIEDLSFWQDIPRDPRWSLEARMMMNMCDLLKTGKFIRLKILP